MEYRGRVPADTLSNRLVLARRLAGFTIDQAAEAAGVKPSSLANWEQGMRPQRETDVLEAIAVAYDVDLMWLMYGGPLIPARGKPTKRAAARTEPASEITGQYPDLALWPTSGPDTYPNRSVRPPENRPKDRVDSRRSTSAAGPGRRAVPIR